MGKSVDPAGEELELDLEDRDEFDMEGWSMFDQTLFRLLLTAAGYQKPEKDD